MYLFAYERTNRLTYYSFFCESTTIEHTTLGNKLDGPEGDVADLSSDLVNINNPIGDLNSTLLCLKKNLSAIFTEVDAFKAQIKNMDTDLTYLKSHTDFLKYDLSEVNQSLLDFINWQTHLHQCLAKSRTSWWHQRRCYRDYSLLNGATIGLLEDHQAAKEASAPMSSATMLNVALAFISGGRYRSVRHHWVSLLAVNKAKQRSSVVRGRKFKK